MPKLSPLITGVAFHGIVALYFWTIAPKLVAASSSVMRDSAGPIPWLGWLIVGIILLELLAFPPKMKRIRSRQTSHAHPGAGVFLLWMFHAAVSAILILIASKSWQTGPHLESEISVGAVVALFVIVIKELYFLLLLLVPMENRSLSEAPVRAVRCPEFVLDFALLVYAAVAHSLIWFSATTGSRLGPFDSAEAWLNLAVAALLFLMLYLPLRIPYWTEEWEEARTWVKRSVLALSLLAAVVAGLWNLS